MYLLKVSIIVVQAVAVQDFDEMDVLSVLAEVSSAKEHFAKRKLVEEGAIFALWSGLWVVGDAFDDHLIDNAAVAYL